MIFKQNMTLHVQNKLPKYINASPALPFGNASALWFAKGVPRNSIVSNKQVVSTSKSNKLTKAFQLHSPALQMNSALEGFKMYFTPIYVTLIIREINAVQK